MIGTRESHHKSLEQVCVVCCGNITADPGPPLCPAAQPATGYRLHQSCIFWVCTLPDVASAPLSAKPLDTIAATRRAVSPCAAAASSERSMICWWWRPLSDTYFLAPSKTTTRWRLRVYCTQSNHKPPDHPFRKLWNPRPPLTGTSKKTKNKAGEAYTTYYVSFALRTNRSD